MINQMKIGGLILCLLFCLAGCMTTTIYYGAIQGEVQNSNSQSIGGVLVEGGGASTVTDQSGKFLLNQVPVGEWYVFFSKEGYTGTFLKAEVKKDEITTINQGVVVLPSLTEDNLLNYIFSLYQHGFYQRSLEETERFLTEYPQSHFLPEVTFVQGASYFYLGNYQNAQDTLSYLVDYYPNHNLADDGLYLLGKTLSSGLGKYGLAVERYQALVENYPTSEFAGAAYYEMGDCYYILGDYNSAFLAYQEAGNFGGEIERQSIYSMAHCQYKLENFLEAASYFNQYVSRYPNTDISDDAQYFEGAAYYEAGQFTAALQAFERCSSNYPNGTWYNGILIAPAALFHQGLCLEKLGRYREAYQTYLKIIRDYPGACWADGSSLIKSVKFRLNWLEENFI